MSQGQTWRALVSERLAAAAEDIFVLFERTITEYEEELRRSKEETRRKQQLLDSALSPRTDPICGNVHIPSASPEPGLKLETPEAPGIKEEPEDEGVKQEEEQTPVALPESSAVCVNIGESSLFQQRPLEHREEAQEEEGHTEPSDCHSNGGWGFSFGFSAAQVDPETDGDQLREAHSATRLPPSHTFLPETIVQNEELRKREGKWYQCWVCHKTFGRKSYLQVHLRVHTGEKPYGCTVCMKSFSQKSSLLAHMRIHTGERPYACSVCHKTFTQKGSLDLHTRTHTGEKLFSCSVCERRFSYKEARDRHLRTHAGEAPLRCLVCHKTFALKRSLQKHMVTHAGGHPHGALACRETFEQKCDLQTHDGGGHSFFSENQFSENIACIIPKLGPSASFDQTHL